MQEKVVCSSIALFQMELLPFLWNLQSAKIFPALLNIIFAAFGDTAEMRLIPPPNRKSKPQMPSRLLSFLSAINLKSQ